MRVISGGSASVPLSTLAVGDCFVRDASQITGIRTDSQGNDPTTTGFTDLATGQAGGLPNTEMVTPYPNAAVLLQGPPPTAAPQAPAAAASSGPRPAPVSPRVGR